MLCVTDVVKEVFIFKRRPVLHVDIPRRAPENTNGVVKWHEEKPQGLEDVVMLSILPVARRTDSEKERKQKQRKKLNDHLVNSRFKKRAMEAGGIDQSEYVSLLCSS